LVLLAGVFAFLVMAPKPARADGILQPVTDAVDQATATGEQAIQQVSTTVDDVATTVDEVSTTVDDVATTVDDLATTATTALDADQTVVSTMGAVVTALDQVVVSVAQTADATVEAVGTLVSTAANTATDAGDVVAGDPVLEQAGVPDPPALPTGSGDPVPDVPQQAPPASVPPNTSAHHRHPVPSRHEAVTSEDPPGAVAVTGRSTGVSSDVHSVPAAPQHVPVGAAIPAGDGSPTSGGRAPTALAVILVVALLLAGASSRRLRLFGIARAPSPFIPILVSPG
jgi:hypothetical protein